MMKRILILLAVGFLGLAPVALAAESETKPASAPASETDDGEESDKLIIKSVDGSPASFETLDDSIIKASHPSGVQATYRNATLTAKRLSINSETQQTQAEGDVRLQRSDSLWVGERLSYNFETGELQGEYFKVGDAPFFASGSNLTGSKLDEDEEKPASADLTERVYTASNGMITTDDIENPVYRIKAKTLIVFPGKRIAAYGATAYVGKMPVFYWPYYRRDYAERHPNNIELTPGYRSLFGPFLLGAYNWQASTNLSGSVNLDYRQKRGFGGGPDVNYNMGRFGKGAAKFYMTRDDDPGTNNLALPIESRRHRLHFTHRAQLRPGMTARGVVRWQSDEFIIRDFFESEYRLNPQPSTFFELSQFWRNFSLNAYAQPQVNDFYDTVERLPDIRLTGRGLNG